MVQKKRQLDEEFITALLRGDLKELLQYIKRDNSLDLEIRENYINIYYLGGNILKVSKKGNTYKFSFNFNYLKPAQSLQENFIKKQKTDIQKHKADQNWNAYFPLAKQAMDFHFSTNHKEEREFQQLIVRENNYSSVANSTDFFIIDIEYDNRAGARFDIVAVEWPSVASIRKLQNGFKPKLVVIEMKYGDGAFKGSASLKKHCDDFNSFSSSATYLNAFKSEMLTVFSQKRLLGLIPCLSVSRNDNDFDEFEEEIDLVFLISNHDPASSILQTELTGLSDENIKFITSNFMGYGFYNHNIFYLDQFLARFGTQIYALQNI
ncbi:MAG: hypothetical protein ABR595_09340 [Psychroflexus sp.]